MKDLYKKFPQIFNFSELRRLYEKAVPDALKRYSGEQAKQVIFRRFFSKKPDEILDVIEKYIDENTSSS